MGDKINLKLNARNVQGKKVAQLRKEGLVPGVVYGHGINPVMVQSEYNVLEKVVREAGRHSPVYLDIDGDKKMTLIKDIDRDPAKHRIRHVSFHAIKADELVTTEVAIRLLGLGESEAEKAGLIILQAIETVGIKAKPADLPEALEVSVEGLKTPEDKLTFADVQLPKGVAYADLELDEELVIANVYEPAALEAANEAAAGDADESSEPEVEAGAEAAAAEPAEAEDAK